MSVGLRGTIRVAVDGRESQLRPEENKRHHCAFRLSIGTKQMIVFLELQLHSRLLLNDIQVTASLHGPDTSLNHSPFRPCSVSIGAKDPRSVFINGKAGGIYHELDIPF